jgi:hypothetical protein
LPVLVSAHPLYAAVTGQAGVVDVRGSCRAGEALSLAVKTSDLASVRLRALADGFLELSDGIGNRAVGRCGECGDTRGAARCASLVGEEGALASPMASTEVDCPSGNKFSISTGTDGGSCHIDKKPNGDVSGGSCEDGNNKSSADCGSNGGSGACGDTSGSGTCTSKTAR